MHCGEELYLFAQFHRKTLKCYIVERSTIPQPFTVAAIICREGWANILPLVFTELIHCPAAVATTSRGYPHMA